MKNNGILKELTPKKVFAIIAAFLLGQALFGGIIYSVSNTHKIVTLQIKNEKIAEDRYKNLLRILAEMDEKFDLKILNLKIEVNEKLKHIEMVMNERFKRIEERFEQIEDRFERIEDDIRIIKKAIVKKHPDLAQELISKKDKDKTLKDEFSGMGGSDEE